MKSFRPFIASILICSGAIVAQETPRKGQPESGKEKTEAKEAWQADQEIAAIKLSQCRNEVELAKFAQQKSQNEQVRQFAAKMVKEHGEACKELEKWVGDYRTSDSDRTESDDAKKVPAADEKAATRLELETKKGGVVGVDFNASNKDARSGQLNWVAIHQQMSDKCLAAAKKELSAKEGAEFDKCFMGMQISAHHKTIIADEVLVNYVSSANREKIEKCREIATEHLEMAKTIHKELDGKSVKTAAKSNN
jgi:predicted outer membrane protein